MNKFCAIIPVGPGDAELERTRDLAESLWAHEPETQWLVLIDDGGEDRRLADRLSAPAGRVVSIFNTRGKRGIGPTSALAAGMLLALKWIEANTDASFIVKLDTDALVIAPFAEKLARAFAETPSAGMGGLYDKLCNGQPRDQSSFRKMLHKLAAPAAIWRDPAARGHYLTCHWWGRAATVRRHIREAIARGYRPAEFILGGAYAISREAIRRMAGAGYFDDPMLWLGTHFSEDIVLSMYTCATGLRLLGLTADGEPFAVQHYGLPDSPERLLARGYSIIHSIKSDPHFNEVQIREFYQRRRLAPR